MKKDLKIEYWPVANLIPYELNAKKHEKDQVARIAEEIRRHGFDQPIVVDRDGVIIKGHGRRLAAISLGMDKVPVLVRSDLTQDQVRAARLGDNRVAISDLDPEVLRAALAEIEEDLTGVFDAKELEFMEADLGSMNTDAFITDMGAAVAEQKSVIADKTAASVLARVPLAKAFGFKDISAGDLAIINKTMARAEAVTGMTGDQALVNYLAMARVE